ncbi:MAG: hypothetical protein ABR517_08565 [Thermoanaerobaculia bacterium]
MKTGAVVLVLGLAIATLGCASAGQMPADLLPPEIDMVQFGDYSFSLQYAGPTSILFEVAITNKSSEMITIRQLKLASVGTGAYVLRRDPHFLNKDIPPGETLVTRINVPAYAQGGATGSREPVTVRGTAYFDSEYGPFQRVFLSNFVQGGGPARD